MAENGIARQPRAWLLIGNDTINIMAFEARLIQSAGQQSTAEITMAVDDPTNPGAQFWSQGGLIPASLIATNGDAQKTTATILTGYIDYATVDFGTRTVTAQMSDKGRPLLDTRSDASWTNQTTSQIVTQLASQAGLQVVAGPGSMAGDVDAQGNTVFNSDLETPWDVIQTLAHQDGYVAFVVGNTLYYVAPGTAVSSTYAIHYRPPQIGREVSSQTEAGIGTDDYDAGNMEKLNCIHNFDLGQGVQYGVMSWKQSDNQAYTAMAGAGKYQGAARIPNKTQQQVQQLANAGQRYAQMHEYTIDVQMRGDVVVQPTMMIALSGTQTSFDMTYYMYEVVHRMNDDDGYDMEITGYNSPQWSFGYSPNPDLPNPDPNQPKQPTNPFQQTPVQGFTMLTGSVV